MKRIALLLTSLFTFGALMAPATALAFDPFGPVCSIGGGSSAVCQEKDKNSTNPLTGKNGLFIGISNILAVVAGLTAVIIIIISGLRYVLAAGDPAKTKAAKDSIITALVGLVVIGLADSLITIVLSRL